MRTAQTLIDKRRNEILNILTQQGFVKVKKLSELTNTSTLTIRRDLDALELENKVERFYGGASLKRKKEESRERDGPRRHLYIEEHNTHHDPQGKQRPDHSHVKHGDPL